MKRVCDINLMFETKHEEMESELQQLRLTVGQQAYKIKQLIHDSRGDSDRRVSELLEANISYEREVKELRELVETLKLRDSRLNKVDTMQ